MDFKFYYRGLLRCVTASDVASSIRHGRSAGRDVLQDQPQNQDNLHAKSRAWKSVSEIVIHGNHNPVKIFIIWCIFLNLKLSQDEMRFTYL